LGHKKIIDALLDDLKPLRFAPPVTHVYNPLEYARKPYLQYCQRYGTPAKEIVLIGMNPGPWGGMHPKRPVLGFDCTRSEVSGKRLWGWAQRNFETPARFFSRFFVANYCPLQFIESSGRNRTPNQLRKDEKTVLLAACDKALKRTIEYLKPRFVIGVGKFAQDRARIAISDPNMIVGGITHPSPANPKANRGWDALVQQEFKDLGIKL
jgi:single-strand selective monofunctional uracil DNA glycosylase